MGDKVQEALGKAQGVMEDVLYPLTPGTTTDVENTYSKADLEDLKMLKREVDPGNVFRFGIHLQ